MQDYTININGAEYEICDNDTDGWSYCRTDKDYDEDKGESFATHTEALQAAMHHEETRHEIDEQAEEWQAEIHYMNQVRD